MGLALILPTELFSMVFSVLKTLTFNVGSAHRPTILRSTGVDAIAPGYQVGMLLYALVIWVGLNQFMTQLAPPVGICL